MHGLNIGQLCAFKWMMHKAHRAGVNDSQRFEDTGIGNDYMKIFCKIADAVNEHADTKRRAFEGSLTDALNSVGMHEIRTYYEFNEVIQSAVEEFHLPD